MRHSACGCDVTHCSMSTPRFYFFSCARSLPTCAVFSHHFRAFSSTCVRNVILRLANENRTHTHTHTYTRFDPYSVVCALCLRRILMLIIQARLTSLEIISKLIVWLTGSRRFSHAQVDGHLKFQLRSGFFSVVLYRMSQHTTDGINALTLT